MWDVVITSIITEPHNLLEESTKMKPITPQGLWQGQVSNTVSNSEELAFVLLEFSCREGALQIRVFCKANEQQFNLIHFICHIIRIQPPLTQFTKIRTSIKCLFKKLQLPPPSSQHIYNRENKRSNIITINITNRSNFK